MIVCKFRLFLLEDSLVPTTVVCNGIGHICNKTETWLEDNLTQSAQNDGVGTFFHAYIQVLVQSAVANAKGFNCSVLSKIIILDDLN